MFLSINFTDNSIHRCSPIWLTACRGRVLSLISLAFQKVTLALLIHVYSFLYFSLYFITCCVFLPFFPFWQYFWISPDVYFTRLFFSREFINPFVPKCFCFLFCVTSSGFSNLLYRFLLIKASSETTEKQKQTTAKLAKKN